MYGNITHHGVSRQKKPYGPNGDKVIYKYSPLHKAGKTQAEIIKGMTNKLKPLFIS